MRARGVAGSAGRLGVSDHGCWIYGSDREYAEFRKAALRFAADGLALGQRLLFVGDRSEDEVLADLAPFGDVDTLRRRGALDIRRRADVYLGGGQVADPDAQLAAYDLAVEDAIAAGYTGVRVVAEVTGLLTDPSSCDQQVRWEMVGDRYMATSRPLAALCGYDRRVIGDAAAAVLTCVHPVRHDESVPFALFADDGALCLTGEVDAFEAPLLTRALAAVPPDSSLVLDVSDLRFIDVAGTAVLARHAVGQAANGLDVSLRGARPLLRRMWDMLGFCDESVRFT
jgi:anti-anti-sigma factor